MDICKGPGKRMEGVERVQRIGWTTEYWGSRGGQRKGQGIEQGANRIMQDNRASDFIMFSCLTTNFAITE